MKKYILAFIIVGASSIAFAQNNPYKNILVSEDIQMEEKGSLAQNKAKELLNKKIDNSLKDKFSNFKMNKRFQNKKALAKLSPAPFGLSWGAPIEGIKDMGVILTKIEEKDYVNSFRATQLPKPIKEFRAVDITFGEENELWRILAYGNLQDDDDSASKVLRLYRIYYDLLNQKYGNGKQFFSPRTYNVDVIDKQGKTQKEQRTEEMGAPGFLKSLQSGEATLYATFNNQEIGAALAVNVDGEGKSYIVIDYKNIKILRNREQITLDAL